MIGRRSFIATLGGIAMALPGAARAQAKVPLLGFLGFSSPDMYPGPDILAATRAGLAAQGFVEGKNVAIEYRWAEGHFDRLPAIAAELVARKVDVIFGAAGPSGLRAVRQATTTVPFVTYDFETDPVADGFADGVARPGQNISGVFLDLPGFADKWFELLRECVPQLERVAMILDPGSGRAQVASMTKVAAGLGIKTETLQVKTREDYAGVVATAKEHGAGAMLLPSSPLVFVNAKELAELSLRHRLPAITLFSEFARDGGLLSYGPNVLASTKQAAAMAGKVLAGTAVSNLPLERPSTFELIVNQRTAAELGLKIPAIVAGRADATID
jgi:putative ABC transport system substrate-binding protein